MKIPHFCTKKGTPGTIFGNVKIWAMPIKKNDGTGRGGHWAMSIKKFSVTGRSGPSIFVWRAGKSGYGHKNQS